VLRTGVHIASSPPLGHHHSYIFIPKHTAFHFHSLSRPWQPPNRVGHYSPHRVLLRHSIRCMLSSAASQTYLYNLHESWPHQSSCPSLDLSNRHFCLSWFLSPKYANKSAGLCLEGSLSGPLWIGYSFSVVYIYILLTPAALNKCTFF
jgi:hypothetical protein